MEFYASGRLKTKATFVRNRIHPYRFRYNPAGLVSHINFYSKGLSKGDAKITWEGSSIAGIVVHEDGGGGTTKFIYKGARLVSISTISEFMDKRVCNGYRKEFNPDGSLSEVEIRDRKTSTIRLWKDGQETVKKRKWKNGHCLETMYTKRQKSCPFNI